MSEPRPEPVFPVGFDDDALTEDLNRLPASAEIALREFRKRPSGEKGASARAGAQTRTPVLRLPGTFVGIVVAGLLLLGSAAASAERFHGSVSPIEPQLRQRMTGVSWHRGCPVGFDHLRLLRVSHWGFDGRTHHGRLVVNRDSARPILGVMRTLFRLRFPIRRMRLVDAYGADDHRSMDADNTSAFNCRVVAGTDRWSEHAYGHAIDLNPRENPYVTASGYVSPVAGKSYADRSRRIPGLIHRRGPVVAAFAAAGWEWGGNWSWPKDYQHFSANGN